MISTRLSKIALYKYVAQQAVYIESAGGFVFGGAADINRLTRIESDGGFVFGGTTCAAVIAVGQTTTVTVSLTETTILSFTGEA